MRVLAQVCRSGSPGLIWFLMRNSTGSMPHCSASWSAQPLDERPHRDVADAAHAAAGHEVGRDALALVAAAARASAPVVDVEVPDLDLEAVGAVVHDVVHVDEGDLAVLRAPHAGTGECSLWRRLTYAMHSSLVSSILTGRRTFLASSGATIMKLLLQNSPNEQPSGSATTRVLLSGMPNACASPSRSSDGDCEPV